LRRVEIVKEDTCERNCRIGLRCGCGAPKEFETAAVARKSAQDDPVAAAAPSADDSVERPSPFSGDYDIAPRKPQEPRGEPALKKSPKFADDAVALGKQGRGAHAALRHPLQSALEANQRVIDEPALRRMTAEHPGRDRTSRREFGELGQTADTE
jgi:hypothetical protein